MGVAKKKLVVFKGFLSFLILHELASRKLSGDELAQVIGERKGSVLTPGTIYPTLKRLRKLQLITFRRDGRKKYYSVTDLGKKELKKLYGDIGRYFKGLKKYL
jgi:PadR family transcriptional regulator, regulatory protein PadR